MSQMWPRHRRACAMWAGFVLAAIAGLLSTGCNGPTGGAANSSSGLGDALQYNKQDAYGRTYYIDGAGNWGFGITGIHSGLRKAGYKGNIIVYRWSLTLNPAMDQTVGRPVARERGRQLGEEITAYAKRFPNAKVNIICLSAGTGVGVWACENVRPPAKVDNLIMLGSSISSRYDMRRALKNISGGVWVYCSSNDMILQGPVRTLGTIDGQMGVDSAGLVGLRTRDPKIHNIRWRSRYARYGWTGSHTDATSEPFVRAVLSRHIVPSRGGGTRTSDAGVVTTADEVIPAAYRLR